MTTKDNIMRSNEEIIAEETKDDTICCSECTIHLMNLARADERNKIIENFSAEGVFNQGFVRGCEETKEKIIKLIKKRHGIRKSVLCKGIMCNDCYYVKELSCPENQEEKKDGN